MVFLIFFFYLFRRIGAYDSLVLIISTQVFLYEHIFFVHSAPIGDKTRKPKLLKPQPRKLVLVSTRLQQYNYHLVYACSAIVYFNALLFFSWKLDVASRGVFTVLFFNFKIENNNYACFWVKVQECHADGTQSAFSWLSLTEMSFFHINSAECFKQ